MNIYLTLLRNRPQFRLLWIAQVISLTGDWFNTIAIIALVNKYTDSGTAIGGLFLARALPLFLLGPIAGVVADRFNRKHVLIVSNAARILIVLGFLLVDSAADMWLIYLLTILQFSLSAFFEPAHAAILPNLVPREDILTANTLGSITWSAMLTLGAAIGGLTTYLVGIQAALVIDAATFGVAALIVTFISVNVRRDRAEVAAETSWMNLVDGMRYVRFNPTIGLLVLVKAISHIGSVDVIVTVYADHVFPVGTDGEITLGLMFAAFGLGSILAPLFGNWLGDGSERMLYRSLIVGFVMIPTGWLIMAIAPSLTVALLAAVIRGMGGSLNWTYSSALLQIKVPDKFLGRVFGLDFMLFTLAMSGAVWFSGLAIDQFDLTGRDLAMWYSLTAIVPLVAWLWLARVPSGMWQTSLQPVEEN